MLWSVERPFAGASAFHIPGATLRHCSGLVTAVLPASTEHGKRTIGVPREPGRSCRLLRDIPAGATGLPTPGPGGALVRRGAKRTSERRGTAKRRQRSAAGRAAGSRSALILPWKQGNSPRRTLWREAKRRPADPSEGNRWGTSRLRTLSTQLARIVAGTLPGMAKLSVEEPDALMHARPGPWEPWRVTARATQPSAPHAMTRTYAGVSDEWH
jgi:hypothetical protein